MDAHLLDILVCPKCKCSVKEVDEGRSLECVGCSLKFPVRDGIPVMQVQEAYDSRNPAHAFDARSEKFSPIRFSVVSGPDVNMTFELDRGTCRAIGRAGGDPEKTSVFSVDIALELDETMKRLVQQYISRQFKKQRMSSFRRAADIVLTDMSLTRLHSMIFYDETGVAILDLVSKNGTYVNGKEVESKLLAKGDTIEMGETTISFEG